jgi:peptide/nickel transport system permease protein
VFALPGIGRELVDGISQRNYDVVMALILITAFFVVFANTFVDILYILIDPRISKKNG